MTTKLIIDKEQNTVFIKRSGRIATGEMIKGTKDLVSNPFFSKMKKSLSDVSGADLSDISNREFEAYAQYCKTTLRNVEFAIIAPNDLTFGIARMFEMLSELENIYVTREVDDALAWLEVTLPENY